MEILGWLLLRHLSARAFDLRLERTFLFGAKGTPNQLRRLPLRIALVQLPCLALFYWLEGWRVLPWAAALIFSTAIYNWPRYGLKARPPFEILNQIGYLLVFVIASWLCNVPQLPWFTMVFGALFAMHSHLFGEIMDVVPDRLAGRRTTAGEIGIVHAKFLLAICLAIEAIIVGWFSAEKLLAGFLALAACWFVADATLLWRDRLYETWQMRLFLLGWNVIALATMPLVWWSGGLTRGSG
ncbi:MAG: hypothetical protein M3R59_09610 [Verrucomicrobiota bacterium]|nr:hypothetical protein [Verrucomicrobiota bacterium]